MKKILGFLVMGFACLLPLGVNADSEIKFECDPTDSNGNRTCTVSYVIDANSPQDSVSVELHEEGGADVTNIEGISDSYFSISTKNETTPGVWNVLLVSPESMGGEFNLFKFTYKVSGETNCKVRLKIGEVEKEVVDTPNEPVDTPTDNKETGASLPIIALGAVGLIALVAYATTKNKSKMYRI